MPDDPEPPSESEASLSELMMARLDEEDPYDYCEGCNEEFWQLYIAESPDAPPPDPPPPPEQPDDLAALLAAFTLGEGAPAAVSAPDPGSAAGGTDNG